MPNKYFDPESSIIPKIIWRFSSMAVNMKSLNESSKLLFNAEIV